MGQSNTWRFAGNELKYVKEVLDSGFGSSTSGNMNQRLEAAFAKQFDVKFAITSTSGTTTLHQALAAFGVGPGDEVIVPALTVISCANAVIYTGAKPIFADIDPRTFLIDPADIEKKITLRTKAIMPVHLYGLMCDMDAIMTIAQKHKLFVLEDCAECVMGTDNKERVAGTIGDVGSFSFENSKHLSTGDGGILITNNEKLAERMRKFGVLGYKNVRAINGQVRLSKDIFQDPTYERHNSFGWNYRLPEVAAAVGLAQLEKIDEFVSKRQATAAKYLAAIENCTWLTPQFTPDGFTNSYWTFALALDTEKRPDIVWSEFRKKFIELGGDSIYAAWIPLYKEPIMQLLHKEGKFFDDLKPQAPAYKGFLDGVNCPVVERVQPQLMQFTTNQGLEADMDKQMNALKNTIKFYEK